MIAVLEFGEFLNDGKEVSAEILHSIAVRSSGVVKEICNLAQRERVIRELCCQQCVDVAAPQGLDGNHYGNQM